MTPESDPIDWLDADTDEVLRWTGRPGVYPVVPFLVIGIGVGLFGVFLATLLTSPSSPLRFALIGLFAGLGLFVAGRRSADQRRVAYAITTDAVYEKRGTAPADVSSIPLAAIESTLAERSRLGDLIDRGTIRISAPAAGRTTLALEGISRPSEVRSLLARHPDTADSGPNAGPESTGSPSSPRSEPLDGLGAPDDAETPDDAARDGRPTDHEDGFVWGAPPDADGEHSSIGRSDTDTDGEIER